MSRLLALTAPIGFVAGLTLAVIGTLEMIDRLIGWWIAQP